MRLNTPIGRLISRHTRELLRTYHREGLLDTRIADRCVQDRFIELSTSERSVYDKVEEYIRHSFARATRSKQTAVGLAMVTYRRRLASSFRALDITLTKRLDALQTGSRDALGDDEDIPDDETTDEIIDSKQFAGMESDALDFEEAETIATIIRQINALPPDTKSKVLKDEIMALRDHGYEQVMVFTQYTDTIDFLRDELTSGGTGLRIMCFSGRGGEVPTATGAWRTITRDEAKQQFHDRQADVLLCSEAAAEGLNFQFCGALINYDMPWNPMKVEQRIGRIDRVGQEHSKIRICNLHYRGTIETDVYQALRERIKIFEVVVGRLQPILSQLPGKIRQIVLTGKDSTELVDEVETESTRRGFDLDAATDDALSLPEREPAPVTMDDLDRIINRTVLLPRGFQVRTLGRREYALSTDGEKAEIRLTTDPTYYERHADSVQLWSPGNPNFDSPGAEVESGEVTANSLHELLEEYDDYLSRQNA